MICMAEVPTAVRFYLTWADDDSAWVKADYDTGEDVAIATVGWTGGEWFFWRIDNSGQIVMDGGHHIRVEQERWQSLFEEAAQVARHDVGAVRDALQAELDGRLAAFRDATKEYVEFAAKVKAKTWWPCYQALIQGCTGFFDARGEVSHDDDTCPVHKDL